MRLKPGDCVSSGRYRYTVVRQVGEGGMSAIYLCQCSAPANSPDAGHWVLKEMTVSYRDRKDQENAVALFLREAQLLQQLKHKNLPRVLEQFILDRSGHQVVAGEHMGQDQASLRYYTVMEFVEGEDLGKMLLRNPQGFPEAKAVAWAIEIATVLYYLHIQKPPIIFRDLKPSNIMISRGQVKLIDFGIARRFDAFKKKDTVRIGSPGYAPPEQYSGQTNARSDIYALGVTLHQLLTGRDPSETQTPFKLPSVRSLTPSVSPATEAIVLRATELDPQARFKTALEMKKALQGILGVQSQPLQALPSAAASTAAPSAPLAPPSAAARAEATSGAPPTGAPSSANRGGNPYARAAAPSAGGSSAPSAPPTRGVRPADASRAAAPSVRTTPAAPSGAPPQGPTVGTAHVPTPAASSTAGGPKPPPAQPVRPGRRARLLAVLFFALAVLATLRPEALTDLLFWLHPPTAPLPSPVGMTSSPSSSPSVSPTPEKREPSLVEQALRLLEEGQVSAALDALEYLRSLEPGDPFTLVAWNNALVRAQADDGVPSETIQAVFADDEAGVAWLRGVALAQQFANAQGGVQDRRVRIAPVAVDLRAPRFDALVEAAQSRKAVAVLVDLPQSFLPAVQAAYATTRLQVLTTGVRDGDAVEATGPSQSRLVSALTAAVSVTKPKKVMIVSAGASSRQIMAVQSALEALRPAPVVTVPNDDADVAKTVAAVRPAVVVLLGDAHGLDRAAARLGALPAQTLVLTGPQVTGVDGGAVGALARAGRLRVVTPFSPDAPSAAQMRFAMRYRRVFARTAPPTLATAQGYEMLNGLLARLDAPDVQWTVEGVRAAVTGATDRLPVFGGTSIGAAEQTGAPWVLVRYKDGLPYVAREVKP